MRRAFYEKMLARQGGCCANWTKRPPNRIYVKPARGWDCSTGSITCSTAGGANSGAEAGGRVNLKECRAGRLLNGMMVFEIAAAGPIRSVMGTGDAEKP